MTELFFDNAATTKPYQEVLEVMMDAYQNWWNPNSSYEPARELREKINEAKRVIADSINADPEEIYFTSGGSEGNCWVLHQNWHKVYYSPTEHHSIMAFLKDSHSYEIEELEVDRTGIIDWIEFSEIVESDRVDDCVAICALANNEVGTIQPIHNLASVAHDQRCWLFVDAVQAYGHIPIDVKKMGIDMITASAHKFHGPVGVGFMYISKNVPMKPMIYGSQNSGMRGGTVPAPLILGMAKAVEMIDFAKQKSVASNRDAMIKLLRDNFSCKINGNIYYRLPNNVSVTFLDTEVTSEQLVQVLSDQGIYCSAGSACNEGSQNPSHVLKAIGLSDKDASHTLRFTLSEDVTNEQINKVIQILKVILSMTGGRNE